MSKQAEAELILRLYELRREPVMRTARDWYFREFNPQSGDDIKSALFSDHSGHLRMILGYWDMAAGLVNHGSIPLELFNSTNGEHFSVFAKIQPFLGFFRTNVTPNVLANLEKLINDTPDGPKRVEMLRERMKVVLAELAKHRSQTPA